MFTGKGGYGFDFKDDLVSANHIPGKRVAELAALVGWRYLVLCVMRNVSEREFHLQALLIDRFCEAAAFLLVPRKEGVSHEERFFA